SNAGGTTEQEETDMPITRRLLLVLTVAAAVVVPPCASTHAFDVVMNAQGEFMDAYLVNGTALPPKVVFIDPDPPNPNILGTPPQGTSRPGAPQGNRDPQGCVFDAHGNMFGNDVGTGDPTDMNPSHKGSVLVFFPGPRHRYDTYCFLDKALSQAGMPAMDEAD